MSALRITWLVLAVVGAVIPMWFFKWWVQANGLSLEMLLYALHTNDATSALVCELIIASSVLTVWIIGEVISGRVPRRSLWSIVATFCIGVSCGLPLFLFFRSTPKR